jgi:DNA-binding MarR family transcriptional regulator
MLGIDPSTASRNLSGLERAGLIARQKGSDDGRQTDVRLTPRGRRAAQSVGSGATQAFGSLLDKVPRSDRARVIDALELVAKVVDAKPR